MMKNLKTQLIQGNTLEFSNDENMVHVWFSKTTNCFCIQLNAQVIESLKTFNVFRMKLDNILKRKEINLEPI